MQVRLEVVAVAVQPHPEGPDQTRILLRKTDGVLSLPIRVLTCHTCQQTGVELLSEAAGFDLSWVELKQCPLVDDPDVVGKGDYRLVLVPMGCLLPPVVAEQGVPPEGWGWLPLSEAMSREWFIGHKELLISTLRMI